MTFIPRILGSLTILLFSGMAVAATINVTETADSFDGSACSLRNAVESINVAADFGGCINSSADGYGVNDAISLTAQTYVLSVGGSDEDDNEFGDLDVLNSVAITGAGSAQTAISASGFPDGETDRVLHLPPLIVGDGPVEPSIVVTLQGLTVRDGSLPDGEGAGVAVEREAAEVTLDDVVITQNLAEEDDAGALVNTDASTTILNSRITNNQAPNEDAGAIDNEGGVLVIDNSTFDNNLCAGSGGAIQNGGILVATRTTFSRNQAVGGISEAGIEGAGISDGFGGAIDTSANMMLVNVTISNNEALSAGGGIWAEDASLPTGDLAELSSLLFNVTVVQNSVTGAGGFGGGICVDCQVLPGGEGPVGGFGVFNSLIAQNDSENFPDCGGSFDSGGYNLIGNIDGCDGFTATGDQTGVADPVIGPLQNNGGPTETHALLEGSPAIDRGNDVDGCQAPQVQPLIDSGTFVLETLTEDQRAFTRPVAVLDPALAICDIGAFEFQVPVPTPTPTPTATPTPPPFQGFIEGSGCSLNPAAGAPAAASLWLALGLAGLLGWRKKVQE